MNTVELEAKIKQGRNYRGHKRRVLCVGAVLYRRHAAVWVSSSSSRRRRYNIII